jgi:hypothetical protein
MLSMMEILWYRLEDKLDFKRGERMLRTAVVAHGAE